MGREHWVDTTLDQIVLHKKGKKPKRLERSQFNNSLPYIDIEAFETGKIKQYADIESSNCCDKNDVLVVWDGARFGLTGYNQRGSVGSTLACLTPVIIETTYLLNFIQRHYQTIQSNPKGTGIPHVNPDIFWNLEIPLPPLNEQKLIVEKLDAILPKVKNAKARLEKIPLILKKFRQSVLSAACSGRLTEDWREGKDLPEWEEIRSGELFSFVTSGSRGWAKYYSETGSLFLRIGNLDHFTVLLDLRKKQYVNPPFGSEGVRTRVQKNDILISITADVGMIGLVPANFEEAYINQHISLARPKPIVNAHYLAWYFASSEGQSQFQEMQRGATKVGLGLDDIKNVKVPYPPLEEQQEIVRRVEKLFTLADSLEAKYKKAIQRVEKIEQSVLAKAFKGELATPDPNDEPADALRKRILEEKTKLETTKKTRSKRLATPMQN